MSTGMLAVIFVVAWVAIGVLAAFWLARRGHRDPLWFVVGIALGPLFAPIAVERASATPQRLERLIGGRRGTGRRHGGVSVLVAVDGSPESTAAVETALRLFGGTWGQLTLAAVVDFDTAEDDSRSLGERAKEMLAEHAALARRRYRGDLACQLLAGRPAQALLQLAEEERCDVLVIGRRGQGLSKRLFGSCAAKVLQDARRPVLVAAPPEPPATGGVGGA